MRDGPTSYEFSSMVDVHVCVYVDLSPKDLMRIEPYMTLRNTKRRIHTQSHTRTQANIRLHPKYIWLAVPYVAKQKRIKLPSTRKQKKNEKKITQAMKKANKHDNLCVYNDFIKRELQKWLCIFSPAQKKRRKSRHRDIEK